MNELTTCVSSVHPDAPKMGRPVMWAARPRQHRWRTWSRGFSRHILHPTIYRSDSSCSLFLGMCLFWSWETLQSVIKSRERETGGSAPAKQNENPASGASGPPSTSDLCLHAKLTANCIKWKKCMFSKKMSNFPLGANQTSETHFCSACIKKLI